MKPPFPRVAAAALSAMLTIASSAACGTAAGQSRPAAQPPTSTGTSGTSDPAPAGGRTDAAQPRYTQADVRFMQGMIAHHGQAVVMTALVPTHTQNRGLRLLAQRIGISQHDEMAAMRRWLEDRGEPVAPAGLDGDMAGMAHANMPGMDYATMPGMLSPAELAQLGAATGPEFDRLFLRYMIRHHEGALAMVAQLLATPGAGQEPQLFGFASDVDADQRAEIARMQALAGAAVPAPHPR
jgi:uncharacterized protein (DUF305 family)